MNDSNALQSIIRAPRETLRRRAVALVTAATIVGLLGACVATPPATASVPASASSPTPTAALASPSATGTDVTAVEAVVKKASLEQQQAFAKNDPTLMKDTATPAYYAALVKLDARLRASGVTAIQPVSITVEKASVQGSVALVTTSETWSATLADGTTVEDTTLNLYTLELTAGAWLIASDQQPSTNVPPGSSPGSMPSTVGTTSRNWSGYVASGGTFTSVSGTWTVPTVTPASPATGADATWVGIGGAVSQDLIQAGTEAIVSNGAVQYDAWIEMLPQPSQTVPLPVKPGDIVTVTITQESTGTWRFALSNTTTGGTYNTTVSYTSSLSSAEWIQEAPSTGKGVVLLDRFGTVNFTKSSAVVNGQTQTPAALGAKAVTMVNNKSGVTLATPSGLGADGASFTVKRG
jgi:hypothetical protein